MRKSLIVMGVFFFWCSHSLFAQGQLRGKVTDSQNGTPIAGASVKLEGGTTGTSTNADGVFSLGVSGRQTIEVSAVGYLPQKATGAAGDVINVLLVTDPKNLNEVVVTALGITRSKNTLPYAAQKIQGSDVSQTRNTNIAANLSGKVAGLEVRQNNTLGGSTNVVLRGAKSLTGSNQALFVVDGIPYDNANNNTSDQTSGRGGYDYGNSAADINPDNIENITVLKGAAASALYGSRGSNGVILITTKKGRKGLGVTINSGVIQSSILRNTFPKYQTRYGEGYGAYFDDTRDIDGDGTPDLVAPTQDDASWGTAFDPNLLVYQWGAFTPGSPTFGKATPWVAAKNDPSTFFVKPLSYNNSVLLETGNDRSSFAMGYTKSNEYGILPNSSVIKDLVNFSFTHKLTNNLTAGAVANYSSVKGNGRFGTGYDGANALNLMTNFRQWWAVNTDLQELKDAYFRNNQNVTWNPHSPATGELQPEFWDNPYFTRYQSVENDSRDRIFGNVYLNYQPLKWLSLLGRVSMDHYSEIEQERKAVGSVGVPFYRRFNQTYNEINYDLLANADWKINEDINVKALLGSNTRVQTRASIDASTNGGLALAGLYTIANSINAPAPPLEYEATRRIEGVFAGGTFTYKNTYILDATIRRDRSSTLPEANNVFYYPSVSGGFIFTNLIKPSWLTYGKLRANYAEVGGDAPSYSVVNTYVNDIDGNSGQQVVSYNGNALFSVSGTRNNPDLKPERTKSVELGLEMTFFRSRLGFDVSYYDAKTVDQILPLTVSTATGYSRKFVNSGTIQNKGVELSLYGSPIKTSAFSWDINVNWTRNRSRVTKLFGDIDNIVLGSFQGSISVNASLNEPYGTIHGTDYVYTNGQKTVDENGNYLISPTNNITIGNINPDWIGGINNKFTYKGVSLSFLVDVRKGGSVFSTDMYYALAGGLYEETAGNNDLGNPLRNPLTNDATSGGIIREGVTADGKPNTVRASTSEYGEYDSYISSPDKRFTYDAGYIKLREAALSYSLPARLFNNKFVKGIDVSLIGRNLAILHKNIPYSDPEEGFSSGNLQGIQTGAYPAVRSVGVNVRFKF